VSLQGFLKPVYPEELERIGAAFHSAQNPAGGGKFDVDHRIIRRDGQIRWLSTRSQTFFSDQNEKASPARTVGAVLDVTGGTRSEIASNLRAARTAEAQRIARPGYWEGEIQTDKIWWSEEGHRFFGIDLSQASVDFRTFLERVHSDNRQLILVTVNRALTEGIPYNITYRIFLPGVTERIVQVQARITLNSKGMPGRLIGTVQDITEQKKMETERVETQKLDSLGLLAGGIAHDFSHILTAVVGNILLAMDSVKREDSVYAILGEAETASFWGKALTDQLVTFAIGVAPVKKPKSIDVLLREAAEFVY
jgi:PAS domain-containing protein